MAGNTSKGTIWDGHNITIGPASFTKLGFLRTYWDYEAKKVYPFLTAIVEVYQGDVRSITWDNSCVFCAKGYCEEITFDYNGNPQTQESSGQHSAGCFIPEKDCQSSPELCDLKLYVVWTGTDANNRAMQSSQSRFGAFPAQNVYNQISQFFPDIPTITGRRI